MRVGVVLWRAVRWGGGVRSKGAAAWCVLVHMQAVLG